MIGFALQVVVRTVQSGFAGIRRELVLELVEETLTSVISHVE